MVAMLIIRRNAANPSIDQLLETLAEFSLVGWRQTERAGVAAAKHNYVKYV